MAGVCLNYLLAASDMHAKNFLLQHTRGTPWRNLSLAPRYGGASAWPYPRRPSYRKSTRIEYRRAPPFAGYTPAALSKVGAGG